MPTKWELLSSALQALAAIQDRIEEASEDDLRELDTLAWQIHDSITGA